MSAIHSSLTGRVSADGQPALSSRTVLNYWVDIVALLAGVVVFSTALVLVHAVSRGAREARRQRLRGVAPGMVEHASTGCDHGPRQCSRTRMPALDQHRDTRQPHVQATARQGQTLRSGALLRVRARSADRFCGLASATGIDASVRASAFGASGACAAHLHRPSQFRWPCLAARHGYARLAAYAVDCEYQSCPGDDSFRPEERRL